MKFGIYLGLLILFASCSSGDTANVAVEEEFSTAVEKTAPFPLWLEGKWHRLNDSEGEHTTEQWSGLSNGKMTGHGLTLKNNDTIFYESLVLEYLDGALHYIVSDVNAEPTHFVCTSYTDSALVFNNELNPFPKNIRYSIKSDTLEAIIDDGQGGNSVTFLFVK